MTKASELEKWADDELGVRYMFLYRNRYTPEAAAEIGAILDVLSRKPLTDRLKIYRTIQGFISAYEKNGRQQETQELRDMRDYFYCRVLG